MTHLIASIGVNSREEFDELASVLIAESYRMRMGYTNDPVYSIQLWPDMSTTWDNHPAEYFNDGKRWISDWVGTTQEYLDRNNAISVNVDDYF